MALAVARETKTPASEHGVRAGDGLAIYAATEVHMSIAKAVALLGLGRENLRLILVDEAFRMVPEQLEQRMRQDKEKGVTPVAVVATAGTVNTGAIDPLPEIAAIAKQYGAWLHIDGAYGALGAIAAQRSSKAWRLQTRFLSIRTSGSISRSTADVCYIVTPAQRSEPSRTAVNTFGYSATTRSKAMLYSRSPSNCPAGSGH